MLKLVRPVRGSVTFNGAPVGKLRGTLGMPWRGPACIPGWMGA
ncbi:MAG: hypothetical protein U0869_06080 [Chloroflexota bacterium]